MAEEDETFDLGALVRAAGDSAKAKKAQTLKERGVTCRQCGKEADGISF